jgi:glycosyltransferase involved in cell wall biosynthesis
MMAARRPLRVAIMYSSHAWRGSATVFAAVGHGLQARGHEVRALVPRLALVQGFAARGVPVRQTDIAHTGLRHARALHRALAELSADVVLADRPRDLRLAAAASLARPIAIVHCLSTPLPATDLRTRIAYRRVRLTVYLTERLAADALHVAPWMGRAALRVIPNGVDTAFYRPDPAAGQAFRERHGLSAGPLLLGVGALTPEKRWDVLLDALATLGSPPAVPPLCLCGGGELEGTLRRQAETLGVRVRFLGALPAAELVGAYNAATCVVHTRPDEVFALALLEALACGRPVVAVAGGGTPELLGEAGVLAPPGDPRAFAGVLHAVLGDAGRRERLAVAARRRAEERFTLDRMVGDFEKALGECVTL